MPFLVSWSAGLRVCLFTSSFLPLVGGAERSADLIVRGLIARGHEAMVLAQRTGELPGPLAYPVRHYHRLPRQHLWPELLRWPLRRAHWEWRFDVILAFDSYPNGYAATWAKWLLGVPVVVSPRGEDVQENFFTAGKARVARCRARGYQRADRIVAISGWCAQRVRAIAGPRLPPMEVVYNGIDVEAEEALRLQSRAQPPALAIARPYVLHLARVGARKQQTTAVRAVHLAAAECRKRGMQYAIVGEGRALGEVRQLIESLGVGDIVKCLGTQTGLNKAWLYDNAEFCVTAAEWEAFGHVLIEAMAAGKAMLASDVPTHREVLGPHGAGIFFKMGDAADMARQMVRMMDEAAGLRAAALAGSRHFTLTAMIDGYEKACLACLSGANK